MEIYIIITLLAIILILLIILLRKNNKPSDNMNEIVTVRDDESLQANTDLKHTEIDKVVFGDLNNPDVIVSNYNYNNQEQLIKFDDNKKLTESLNVLINPNILNNSLELSSKFRRVVFPVNYDHFMKSDGITVATAMDSKGKIIPGGQGRILGKAAAFTGLAFQAAAIITAQKFLADINESLVKIEKGISDIKDFMESEMKGKVIGNLNHLKKISTIIKSSNYTEQDINNYYQSIERIDLECSQIISSINLRRQKLFSQIKNMDFSITNSSVKLEKKVQEINNVLQDITKENNNYLMGLFVKVASSHTRLSMPLNNSTVIHNLEEINLLINEEMKINEEFYLTLKSKIRSLKKKGFLPQHFGKSAEDYANSRNQLGRLNEEIKEAKNKLCKVAKNETAKLINDFDKLKEKPTEIIIELDNKDEIKNIFKPGNNN